MTSVVGTSVPRIEGRWKVTGASVYATDVHLPGMLWARILRSDVPHARLLRVDTSAAEALPGVHAVISGADLAGLRTGVGTRDMPVLCADRVRYVGDPIAAVAAETAEIADAALKLIEVDYEELPTVFSPAAALADGALALHPERASYASVPQLPDGTPPNVQGLQRLGKGDVDQGLAEADPIFEHTFETPASHQGYIEPRGCVVRIDDDGTVRVWSSCQSPFALRGLLASLVGLPADQVVVESSVVGGSFGAKGAIGPEPIAYFLARAGGRPVKLVHSYHEELIAANPRHPSTVTLTTGVKRDGTLVARRARIVMDGGAYAAYKPTPNLVLPSVARALGPYRIPHTSIETRFVYTNNAPGGVARAPAQPQVVFAGESQMDLIAEALGLDPLDFRLRNVAQEGDIWPHNGTFEGVMTRQTLDLLREASHWDQPLGPNEGRGMAMSERPVNMGASGLQVTVHDDGTASGLTGIADAGTGVHTILKQMLAEELHLPLEAISVQVGGTDEALFDSGMGGSKHTASVTVAVLDAADQVMARLKPVAAEQLECSAEDLELAGQRFQVRGHAGLGVAVQAVAAEAANRAGGTLVAESRGPDGSQRAPQSTIVAYAVEVVVDADTGQVRPKRVTAVHDVGRAINPQLLQAQIYGATIQGLGQALMEDLARQDGRVQAGHLGDYKLPTSMDVPPEIVSVFVEGASGFGPYQAKSVAELSNVTLPAAVANAVARASGARVMALPVTAERVLASRKHGRAD